MTMEHYFTHILHFIFTTVIIKIKVATLLAYNMLPMYKNNTFSNFNLMQAPKWVVFRLCLMYSSRLIRPGCLFLLLL